MRREARGSDLRPDVAHGRVTLGYVGPDGQRRRTLLRFSSALGELASDRARFELALRPGEEVAFDLVVACLRGEESPEPIGFDAAAAATAAALERQKAGSCKNRDEPRTRATPSFHQPTLRPVAVTLDVWHYSPLFPARAVLTLTSQ